MGGDVVSIPRDHYERLVRAAGWASVEEYDAFASYDGTTPTPFVIMDCRTIVGNTPLFWMPNGNGYGSVVSDIGRYPEHEAKSKRETDFAMPLDLAVVCARPRIDIQLLNRELEVRGLPVPMLAPPPPERARRGRHRWGS